MALCGQMDDAVHVILLHQRQYRVKVTDVQTDKLVVRLVFDILQVSQIARIRQLVHIDDAVFRILVHKKADHMAAYEAGTAGDDNIAFEFHNQLFFIFSMHTFSESIQ